MWRVRRLRVYPVLLCLPLLPEPFSWGQPVAYPGVPVTGELGRGESRNFRVRHEAGEMAIARAEQLSGDVTLGWRSSARRAAVDRIEAGGEERILWREGELTFA